MNLRLTSDYTWRFVIADVDHPIIGVNLKTLWTHSRLEYKSLLDGFTKLSTPVLLALPSVPRVNVVAGGVALGNNQEEFPGLTNLAEIYRWIITTQRITSAQQPAHL